MASVPDMASRSSGQFILHPAAYWHRPDLSGRTARRRSAIFSNAQVFGRNGPLSRLAAGLVRRITDVFGEYSFVPYLLGALVTCVLSYIVLRGVTVIDRMSARMAARTLLTGIFLAAGLRPFLISTPHIYGIR